MALATLSESVHKYTAGTTSMLIGDEWVQAASGETFPVYDPASGTEIARAPRAAAEDVEIEPSSKRGEHSKGHGRGSLLKSGAR